jgi:hypothetical protein
MGPIIYGLIYLRVRFCKDFSPFNKISSLTAYVWFVYGGLMRQGSVMNPMTGKSSTFNQLIDRLIELFIIRLSKNIVRHMVDIRHSAHCLLHSKLDSIFDIGQVQFPN